MRTLRMMTRDGMRLVAFLVVLLLASALRAEESAPSGGDTESNTDLAKKTQNPVADLISVPFQNNFNFNTGPEKRSVWDLNIQPAQGELGYDGVRMSQRVVGLILCVPLIAMRVRANAQGWTVISMQKDWKRIFSFDE